MNIKGFESTEFVIDSVIDGWRSVNIKPLALTPRSPSPGFSPKRQFRGFQRKRKIQLQDRQFCDFCGFCVKTKYQPDGTLKNISNQ